MVDDKITLSEEYADFESRHNRHLNMLQENDRNLRKQALVEFQKTIKSPPKTKEVLDYFYRQRLCKRLVLCLDDQVEKNREMTIEIITKMIELCGFKEESQIILPAIASRMSKIPFAEQSEEVRVQLIDLLEACLEADHQQFVQNLGAITQMLGKAATDGNPEMKIKVALFSGKLALALDRRVGNYFKNLVDSLVLNLQHQHSKVRKQTLVGLKDVLACKGAESCFEGTTIAQFKFSMNDRSQDVRAQFYQVLFHWMQKIEIQQLKICEPFFVQFLLNGIADQQLDIGPQCIKFLDEHGQRMKEALIALGEETEESAQKIIAQSQVQIINKNNGRQDVDMLSQQETKEERKVQSESYEDID